MTHETSPEWATPRLEAAITAALCGEWGRCNIAPPVVSMDWGTRDYVSMSAAYGNRWYFVPLYQLVAVETPTVAERIRERIVRSMTRK
jgi:hypothetical protein